MVLSSPIQSPAVIQAGTSVKVSVADFHERLGIDASQHSVETRRWAAAAAEARDRARTMGADAVGAGKRLDTGTRGMAAETTGRVSRRFIERARSRRHSDEDVAENRRRTESYRRQCSASTSEAGRGR